MIIRKFWKSSYHEYIQGFNICGSRNSYILVIETRVIDTKNDKPEILFKFNIERLNTLNRISEWFIEKAFPKMMINIHGTEIKTLSLRELLILNIRPVNYRENL
jgi:hypothetical protein